MSVNSIASLAGVCGYPRARRSRWLRLVLLGSLASFAAHPTGAQERPADGVAWSRTLQLTDGRTFISDGAITLDALLVSESERPSLDVAPIAAPIIERYLAAELTDEFAVTELARGERPQTYEAPTGITLSAKYVDYLRATLSGASLRFRMKGNLDPVVILSDGEAVGVVMPLAQRNP